MATIVHSHRVPGALALAWVAATLALGVKAGCSSEGAPGGAASALDAASDAAPSWGESACGRCVGERCGDERRECAGDPDCARWVACVEACPAATDGSPDAACVRGCGVGDSSTAERLRGRFEQCRLGEGLQCPACPRTADPPHPLLAQQCGPSTETNPCWKCEDEKCCDTYAACRLESPECSAFTDCMKECTLTTEIGECLDTCAALHPGGESDYLRRMACVLHRCSRECGEVQNVCLECGTTACANASVACAADPACNRISDCVGDCVGGVSCIDACVAATPSPAWEPFETCVAERCAASCG